MSKNKKQTTHSVNPNPRFCDLRPGDRFYLSNPKFHQLLPMMEKGENESGAVMIIHLPTGFVAEVFPQQYLNFVGVWPV